jgi:exosortase
MNMAKPGDSAPSTEVSSGALGRNQMLLKVALVVLPLGYFWFHLIDNLRLEWSSNPQYSYGLVVPLLIVGLLIRRWQRIAGHLSVTEATNPWPVLWLAVGLALFFLPIRLIESATPEWRPIQWCLAFETVGLTLYLVYLAGGRGWLRQAAFPVLFFLVAVPWPSPLEQPIIQGLSRANACAVVEMLFALQIPAIQHGNVIEVSTGMVGINDACSGIRSLQSSLMISLFIGEYYFFSWRRRLLLVPLSVTLALLLNLCRTSLLSWLAAKKGVDAIAEYHDEAGMTILMICTGLLWAVGWWLNRRRVSGAASDSGTGSLGSSLPLGPVVRDKIWHRLKLAGVLLIIWVLVSETGIALWFRMRESHLKPGPSWSVNLPRQNSNMRCFDSMKGNRARGRRPMGRNGRLFTTTGCLDVWLATWLSAIRRIFV